MENNRSQRATIDTWNVHLSTVLLPNTILQVLYLFTGILGNSLTLLVYIFRIKITNARFLIPVLAVFDLLACISCSCFVIIEHRLQEIFKDTDFCKTLWCVSLFFTLMSISILTMIAIQRYMKVCRPFAPNMTRFSMRIFLLVSVIVSFTLSVPTAIFYGSVEVFNTELNITGVSCKKIQNEEGTGFLFYGFLVVAMMIFILSLLVLIYGRIIYTLHKHLKKCRNTQLICTHVQSADRNQEKDETENTGNTCVSDNHTEINKGKITKDNIEISKGKTTTTNTEINTTLNHKLTSIFLVITFVLIVSYTPKVVIFVVEGIDDTLWDNLSDSARSGLTFVNELFILNNVFNPLVYFIMDTKFRKESKNICSGMLRKGN